MAFLNSKVSLNKITLDENQVLIVVFIFQRWRNASLQVLAHSTFLDLNNSLLERRLNIFYWNLSHSTIYLEVTNNILITFWYGMPMMSQPHFGLSVRVKLTFPKVGTWSPSGFPKIQSSSWRAKTPHIGVFLVSLERSWSVDV
jgi:hypothetical protein